MTINYNNIDIYFHMKNHYKKLKNAKSTINSSISQVYMKSSSTSHLGKNLQLSVGEKRHHSRRCPHLPIHSASVKSHNCVSSKTKSNISLYTTNSVSNPEIRGRSSEMSRKFGKARSQSTDSGTKKDFFVDKLRGSKKKSSRLSNSCSQASNKNKNKIGNSGVCEFPPSNEPSLTTSGSGRSNVTKSPDKSDQCDDMNSLAKVFIKSSAKEHEYLLFLLRITEDIITHDYYTNQDIKKILSAHIEANKEYLNVEKMEGYISHLCKELNIEDEKFPKFGNSHLYSLEIFQDIGASCDYQTLKDCECATNRSLEFPSYSILDLNLNGIVNGNNSIDYMKSSELLIHKHSLGRVTECTEPTASANTLLHSPNIPSFTTISSSGNIDFLHGFENVETHSSQEDRAQENHMNDSDKFDPNRDTKTDSLLTDKEKNSSNDEERLFEKTKMSVHSHHSVTLPDNNSQIHFQQIDKAFVSNCNLTKEYLSEFNILENTTIPTQDNCKIEDFKKSPSLTIKDETEVSNIHVSQFIVTSENKDLGINSEECKESTDCNVAKQSLEGPERELHHSISNTEVIKNSSNSHSNFENLECLKSIRHKDLKNLEFRVTNMNSPISNSEKQLFESTCNTIPNMQLTAVPVNSDIVYTSQKQLIEHSEGMLKESRTNTEIKTIISKESSNNDVEKRLSQAPDVGTQRLIKNDKNKTDLINDSEQNMEQPETFLDKITQAETHNESNSFVKVILEGNFKEEDFVFVKGPVYILKALIETEPKLVVFKETNESIIASNKEKSHHSECVPVTPRTDLNKMNEESVVSLPNTFRTTDDLHECSCDNQSCTLSRNDSDQYFGIKSNFHNCFQFDAKLLYSDYDLTPQRDSCDNKYHHLLVDATTSISNINISGKKMEPYTKSSNLLLTDDYLLEPKEPSSIHDISKPDGPDAYPLEPEEHSISVHENDISKSDPPDFSSIGQSEKFEINRIDTYLKPRKKWSQSSYIHSDQYFCSNTLDNYRTKHRAETVCRPHSSSHMVTYTDEKHATISKSSPILKTTETETRFNKNSTRDVENMYSAVSENHQIISNKHKGLSEESSLMSEGETKDKTEQINCYVEKTD